MYKINKRFIVGLAFRFKINKYGINQCVLATKFDNFIKDEQ